MVRYLEYRSWQWWKFCWHSRRSDSFIGIFRNLPHVIPGRWGFYIGGLEIGSRKPGDPVGVWLIKHGIWRW